MASSRSPLSRRKVIVAGLIALIASASVAVAVPQCEDVAQEVSGMDAGWIVAAVLLELASCLSFVAIFRHFFHELPARVSWQSA